MDVSANFRIARPSVAARPPVVAKPSVVATPLSAGLSASPGAPASEIVADVRDLPTAIRDAPSPPAHGVPFDSSA
jgi:hypothetical protein